MILPLNLKDFIHGKSVEWERLEFKSDWNPIAVIKEICAFANDFHNLNGGYIVLGIEDDNGRPKLPPKGLDPKKIEKIQKEIRGKCKRIVPEYYPRLIPVVFKNQNILVIWVPAGQNRPYQAPSSFEKNPTYNYYIRQGAETIIAKGQFLNELMQLTAKVPFDDRLNQSVDLNVLDKQLILQFLQKINSELYKEVDEISFEDLCIQMDISDKINNHFAPKNIGLMFFYSKPHKYFPLSQIEIVHFNDDESGDVFDEKIIQGSLDFQIQQTLSYLKSYVIKEKVIKYSNQAETSRFYNYPFSALEEVIVNAVYHRSYEEREPIEIRISRTKIEVLSFPGPVRSVKMKDFDKGRVVSRRYRNRRIGEFLKELHLSEGRSTGVPKICRSMKNNGSPLPIFKTDENRTYFLVTLPIHHAFI